MQTELKNITNITNIKPSIIVVGILFTTFLILSNLTAFKLVQYANFAFPAGLLFFPVTYIFDDILTEVYGFKVSRLVIWTALLANAIVIVGTLFTTYLQPAPYWHEQSAYASVYQAVPRVFFASMLGYLSGEFFNSIILARLKIKCSGRHLWLRLLLSTAIGVGLDTMIFIHIAFLFSVPYAKIWQIILTMYLFKVSYEMLVMPITYRVINYLKRKDSIDHYDIGTKFNPFSIRLNE